jgi:hypothetical protein
VKAAPRPGGRYTELKQNESPETFPSCFRIFSRLLFANELLFAQARTPVVHVFVALADNQHQGIIPVPARPGNGRDPANNLYWGAAFGVKSFFRASSDWRLLTCAPGPEPVVLERCVFHRHDPDAILVADAYGGAKNPRCRF